MKGYKALLYLEWRTLLAQLRGLARSRGRLVVYVLVLAYLGFILSQGRRGVPHFGHAASVYALALWLFFLGLASVGGRRRLLARPADLALVVPSAITPDRIVVWSLVRQAATQLRLLVVVAVFWVPQMAASGGVGWGALLYAVGLTLIAAMGVRYILLGLGAWAAAARYLLLLCLAALALWAGIGLRRGGGAGLAAAVGRLGPLALAVSALHGAALPLVAWGGLTAGVMALMVAMAPRIVRLGVDWGALPQLAGRRGLAWRYSGAPGGQVGGRTVRRRFRRRDWPGRGVFALFGVEVARLYRTLLPTTAWLIALGWIAAAVAGVLARPHGVPWEVVPGFALYLMALTGAAAASLNFGQILATPLWSQTPGPMGSKLLAWFLPSAVVSGIGWAGVTVGWLLGMGQGAFAVWSLPVTVALMLLVRAVGLLGWAMLPNAVDQRGVAVWLRFLFTVVAAAIAAGFFAGAYALAGFAAGAALGSLAAVGEAYFCLQLSQMRIGAMDFVRPTEGRA